MNTGKILHVDDDEIVRIFVAKACGIYGYKLISASCVQSAFDTFKLEDDISLVITDYHMPENGDGLKLQRLIREISQVPVILMSGAGSGLTNDPLNVFDGFVPKPINLSKLFSEIERLSQ